MTDPQQEMLTNKQVVISLLVGLLGALVVERTHEQLQANGVIDS